MDVIEYLENMASGVFNSSTEEESKTEMNKFYGACKLAVDCYPFDNLSDQEKVIDLFTQVAEFYAATYGITLVYDK